LLLVILVYGSVATGAVHATDFLVLQALTALALVLWLARFWLNRGHRIQWPPICWTVIAFLIYALIRYHQADIEFVARQELIRIIVYAALFFIVLNNLHRQKTTQLLVNVMLVLGMLISLYAIYQFITDARHVLGYEKPPAYHGRGSGTFICPNNLAGFLELLLPLALANLFLGRAEHVTRVFYGYISLVLLAGIGVTVSRGGWLATGLGLFVIFAFLARYRAYRRLALVALLVIVAGAYLFVQKAREPQKRLSRMWTPGQVDDAHIRLYLMRAAYPMWRDHFWLGVGPAHFDYRFRAYRPPEVQSRPYWVHNDYLNALVDWGAVGGAIIGAALFCLGAGACKTWKFVYRVQNDLSAKQSDRAAHVLGTAGGLLIILFHSAVDFNMQVPANAILAIVLMASLTSHLRFATDNYWVTPHLVGRTLATVLGAVAIAYLGTQAVSRYKAIGHLRQAQRAKTHPERVAALVAAYLAEPADGDTAYLVGEAYRLWSLDAYSGENVRPLDPKVEEAYRSWSKLLRRQERLDFHKQMAGHVYRLWSFSLPPPLSGTISQRTVSMAYGLWNREGPDKWRELALQALPWFEAGMLLNPYETYNYLRYGMCLDGLKRFGQAENYFKKAVAMDPNNYYLAAMQGRHYLQKGDYQAAKEWLVESLRLKPYDNSIANLYLGVVNQRLAEGQ
jgi:O-antigen ligase